MRIMVTVTDDSGQVISSTPIDVPRGDASGAASSGQNGAQQTGTQPSGTQPSGTPSSGTQPSGTPSSGTQAGQAAGEPETNPTAHHYQGI